MSVRDKIGDIDHKIELLKLEKSFLEFNFEAFEVLKAKHDIGFKAWDDKTMLGHFKDEMESRIETLQKKECGYGNIKNHCLDIANYAMFVYMITQTFEESGHTSKYNLD